MELSDCTTFSFTGIGGASDDRGTLLDGYDGLSWSAEGEHELQALEPGWYSIGIHPLGPVGEEDWFPQATPILYFEAGEHVVEFELLPSARLSGRVVRDAAGVFLAVALVDASDARIPLAAMSGYARPALVHDTSASGYFALHHIPTGRYRLRAGSREELERGEFRREMQLEIRPGENQRVEIRL